MKICMVILHDLNFVLCLYKILEMNLTGYENLGIFNFFFFLDCNFFPHFS